MHQQSMQHAACNANIHRNKNSDLVGIFFSRVFNFSRRYDNVIKMEFQGPETIYHFIASALFHPPKLFAKKVLSHIFVVLPKKLKP